MRTSARRADGHCAESRRRVSVPCAVAIALLGGCGRIAYESLDAGGALDGGALDGGARDGGARDGGPRDAGPRDTGAPPGDAAQDASRADGGLTPLFSRIGVASRIPFEGEDHFVLGGALPWRLYGQDFGTPDGARSAASQAEVDAAYASAAGGGLRVVLWHAFVGTPSPLGRDGDGVPTSFLPGVVEDLQAAIDLAEARGLRLWIVLFGDAGLEATDIADPTRRDAIAAAVGQLVGEVEIGRAGRVLAWSVHNELDRRPETATEVDSFVLAIARAIRARSATFVAAGATGFARLGDLCRSGADIVTVVEGVGECVNCTPYASLSPTIPCPIVLHTAPVVTASPGLLQAYYDQGYAGAFGWSLLPDRTFDGTVVDLSVTAAFAGGVPDEGP